jgi:energy-coupling factor transporter ATP-binding protein EcfA2
MNLSEIASHLSNLNEKIVLIYAFNATGKTRLSVAFKDETKNTEEGRHAGVYYNAFSEDLFVWDNDTENGEKNVRLVVRPSSLNRFHGLLTEDSIREKLEPYNPKFDFSFELYEDTERGIEMISFFLKEDEGPDDSRTIKISRGEERIFVWCFFLALFEVEGWADEQSEHFFIDDPVSSLDDHNIFVTAATLYDLIEDQHENRKIIISTHHIGLFSILHDWLLRGEKGEKFKKVTKLFILKREGENLSLENPKNDIFLYHLRLLQVLDQARQGQLYTHHFALLRQVLENISSFLGVGRVSYVLEQIGIDDPARITSIVNTLSHKNIYYYQADVMVPDNEALFKEVFDKLKEKYNFVLHAG